MARDNRTAFIALPKAVTTKRASSQRLLTEHVAKRCKAGLIQLVPSGDSYLAAVFDNQAVPAARNLLEGDAGEFD